MSLGVWEACRALQIKMVPTFAADSHQDAVAAYNANFETDCAKVADIVSLIDGEIGATETPAERQLIANVGQVDLLIGGPPCQGHSDLNNHTRRSDPKNLLIMRMARFAELFRPRHIIIENVQGIRHDKNGAAMKAKSVFQKLGYATDEGLISAAEIGVPQRRRRFFMVASQNAVPRIDSLQSLYGAAERTIEWACHDLVDLQSDNPFDSSAKHSATNQQRIEYLFRNGIYDLPDPMRPDCHRLKAHDYKAVYGRLRPNEAAPTITTGFGSTGQGRFVHPARQRTITPHEAARLQFFPDFFNFGATGRRALQVLIGNAVPPKMAYVVALELLR
jgi:DNA (cytosine-5)-methyltransferase 1